MILYVLALEPSGDMLGGKILQSLRNNGVLKPTHKHKDQENIFQCSSPHAYQHKKNIYEPPSCGEGEVHSHCQHTEKIYDPSLLRYKPHYEDQNKDISSLVFTDVRGLGGETMEFYGSFLSLWSLRNLSSMGLKPILQDGFLWYKRRKTIIQDILDIKPKMLLTIDSPAFSLPIGAKIKKHLPSTIHLHVHDPALWSRWPYKSFWDLRRCDGLLSLFPRPESYKQQAYGFLKNTGHFYVGHPLMDNIPETKILYPKNPQEFFNNIKETSPFFPLDPSSEESSREFLENHPSLLSVTAESPKESASPLYSQGESLHGSSLHGFMDSLENHRIRCKQEKPFHIGSIRTIGLFPGSRPQEWKKFFPILLESAKKLYKKHPYLSFVVPFYHQNDGDTLKTMVNKDIDIPVVFCHKTPENMPSMDFALCVSGTICLELMKHEIPMIVGYKVHCITAFLVKTLLAYPWISLVNLLGKKTIVPECLQERFSPDILYEKTLSFIEDPLKRLEQKKNLRRLYNGLKNIPPTFIQGLFSEKELCFGKKCGQIINIFLNIK